MLETQYIFRFILSFLGRPYFSKSLDLLLYLSVWILIFEIRVNFFEECSLKKRFGETYEQYSESVHRWIPRLTPCRENDSEF